MIEYSVNFFLTVICIGVILAIGIWFTCNYAIARVEGTSMLPAFKHRELVLIKKKFVLEKGRVYVIDRGDYFAMKRIETIHWVVGSAPRIFFLGDNLEHSIDSRSYGFVDAKVVKGEVIKLNFWRNVQ